MAGSHDVRARPRGHVPGRLAPASRTAVRSAAGRPSIPSEVPRSPRARNRSRAGMRGRCVDLRARVTGSVSPDRSGPHHPAAAARDVAAGHGRPARSPRATTTVHPSVTVSTLDAVVRPCAALRILGGAALTLGSRIWVQAVARRSADRRRFGRLLRRRSACLA